MLSDLGWDGVSLNRADQTATSGNVDEGGEPGREEELGLRNRQPGFNEPGVEEGVLDLRRK